MQFTQFVVDGGRLDWGVLPRIESVPWAQEAPVKTLVRKVAWHENPPCILRLLLLRNTAYADCANAQIPFRTTNLILFDPSNLVANPTGRFPLSAVPCAYAESFANCLFGKMPYIEIQEPHLRGFRDLTLGIP